MRIRYVTLASAFALLFAAAPAAAQLFCFPLDSADADASATAACAAATNTPFGALPTNLPASWLGRTTTGIGFHFGFGSMDEEGDAGRKNFGVGIEIPFARASIGLSGGLVDYTCDAGGADVECKRAIMLGGRFSTPLITSPLGGTGETASSVVMGLTASLGFATGDVLEASFFGETLEIGGRSFLVGLGLPVGIVARSGTVTITPFIEPAFFWGQTRIEVTSSSGSEEDSESGTGFSFGGGLSLGFANGLSLDIGFKKVMIDEANALIGLGLSFQR